MKGIYSPKGFLQKAQLAQKSDCGHFRNDRGHDAETVQNLNAMSNKCLLEEGCRGILYDGAHYYLCSTVPLVSEEEGTFDMYIKGKYFKVLILSYQKIKLFPNNMQFDY